MTLTNYLKKFLDRFKLQFFDVLPPINIDLYFVTPTDTIEVSDIISCYS